MIHVSKIHELVETLKNFSLEWVAESGEIIHCDNCRFTSFHGSGRTFNVMLLPSGEIRTVNRYTVTQINGEEVML